MKPLMILAKVGMVAILAVSLTACGKKKNGSSGTVATTPADNSGTCTQLPTGQWVTSGTNTPCTPGNGQVPPPGSCTTGTNCYGNGYPYGGCTQYEYQYGVQYVPVYMHQYGQYMCVRYDLLQGYATYPQYQNYGYNYYYSYPPYSGSGCHNQVNFGGQWGYVGLCF